MGDSRDGVSDLSILAGTGVNGDKKRFASSVSCHHSFVSFQDFWLQASRYNRLLCCKRFVYHAFSKSSVRLVSKAFRFQSASFFSSVFVHDAFSFQAFCFTGVLFFTQRFVSHCVIALARSLRFCKRTAGDFFFPFFFL